MKKIITVIGARPQIIKSAAISRVVRNNFENKLEEVVVHTGQHYDTNMSDVFFNEMNIPKPKYNLGVGSGSHANQTAEMLIGIESILLEEEADALLVYGDTNSTLAGATAASKLGIPVVHVEAGLRSYNKKMPEEINRIVCDHLSTLLFSPTKSGVKNLIKEGFQASPTPPYNMDNPKVYHCGDVMYDNSMFFAKLADEKNTILKKLELTPNSFYLCTIHRNNNTDDANRLTAIFSGLLEVANLDKNMKIVLPIHPRTKNCIEELLPEKIKEIIFNHNQFLIIEPVSFLNIIALEKNARMIITDSGGLQKEAFFFQKPCVILRSETEWVEIVENGNAIIADANTKNITDGVKHFLNEENLTYPSFYGDGNAAQFICDEIVNHL